MRTKHKKQIKILLLLPVIIFLWLIGWFMVNC